jgi:prepilin-type N-terminal cleavage/methylation domain-containing protein
MRKRGGFTLTELLAVMAMLACLMGLSSAAIVGVKDCSDRTMCAANLSQIGQALLLYSADHSDYLPDCGAASPMGGDVPADGIHFPSRTSAPGTAAWPEVKAVGNQANLWLLVREGYATPQQFVCPATQDRPSLNDVNDPAIVGFLAMDPATGRATDTEDKFLKLVTAGRCSYSYQNQFAHPNTDPLLTGGSLPTTHRLLHPARLAVVADRNPYTRTDLVRQPVVTPAAQPEANSLNHNGAGQNVLYLSGEVEWHDTPRCGAIRADGLPDNIYRPDAGLPTDPYNIPRGPADSFLAP